MSIFLETLEKYNYDGEDADRLHEAHESNILVRLALNGLTEIAIELNNLHSARFRLENRLKKKDKYDCAEAIRADIDALNARSNDLEGDAESIVTSLKSSYSLNVEPFFRLIYIY